MKLQLKKVNKIKTDDVLYDTKLNQICIYQKNIDISSFDKEYIIKNCLKLSITS